MHSLPFIVLIYQASFTMSDNSSFYNPYPIFSASHRDAQDLAIHSSDASNWANSTPHNLVQSDHFSKFQTTVHRLGVFPLERANSKSDFDDGSNSDILWSHWQTHRLGFSSKFAGHLSDIATDMREVKDAREEPLGDEDVSPQRVVRGLPKFILSIYHDELKTRRSGTGTEVHEIRHGDVLESPQKNQNSISLTLKEHNNAAPLPVKIPKWTTLWVLFSSMIGIWDLWAMRAGTGRMLFEEIVLTKSEILFPTSIVSSHWLSDPINQVFPQATEVALNITYLVLALFGWPPASLFAFASVMLTLGQTLSLLAQVYFYPNFLSNPIRLSTVSWVLVLIFRVMIPSVNGFVVCKKLCSLLVNRGRSF
ncbi:hypothetical protein F5890DRAFT_1282455 [Lentinula detonsa]|uniref:Uncharacterized protein n=1 Tax=Lentinula detonsa TaxID=2804962 RepID=A0AA38URZ8_9AGAR|nr:hypothetical protein F5890DRAFT_1282455 [Lentinula detonsa]